MSLHNDIMNIPCKRDDYMEWEMWRGYQLGHRDARHAAAELANAYDEKMEQLRDAIREEAAEVADSFYQHIRQYTTDVPEIGDAIRNLKHKT